MIKLYNKENDVYIGEISEAELKFLVKELAEETYDDQDYYLDENTLAYLQKKEQMRICSNYSKKRSTNMARLKSAGNRHENSHWLHKSDQSGGRQKHRQPTLAGGGDTVRRCAHGR